MGPNNNHNKKSFNRLSPWFVQQQRMLESNLNGPKAGFFFSPFSLSLSLSLSRPLSQSASSLCCPIVCYQTSSWRIGTKVAIVVRNCGCVRRPTCRPRATRTNPFSEFFFSLQQIFISFHNSGSQKLRKNPQRICYQRGDKSTKAEKDELWEIIMTVEIFFGWTTTRGNSFRKKVCNSILPLQLKRSFLIQWFQLNNV